MKLGCLSEKIIIDGQYLSSHQLGTILRLLTMFKQTPIYHHIVFILHLFFVNMLIGTFNEEKVLFVAFSGHCETSRMFVDSSTGQCGQCSSGANKSCFAVSQSRAEESHSYLKYLYTAESRD